MSLTLLTVLLLAPAAATPSPNAGNVLSRLETYHPPPIPSGKGDRTDVYDRRRLGGKPIPPTKADAFICDVNITLEGLNDTRQSDGTMGGGVAPDAATWTDAIVARAIAVYVDGGFDAVLGYRPWAHTHFVQSLSTAERGALAREVAAYARKHGVRTGEDPPPPTVPRQIGEWESLHEPDAWAVAISPDTSRVLVGFLNGWAQLWDRASGEEICVWNLPEGIRVVAFSKDGSLVAIGDQDQTVSVADTKSCKEIASWTGRECATTALAFSADASKVLIGCEDGGVLVGDLAKRRRLPAAADLDVILGTLREVEPQGETIDAKVTFSPDRTRVVIGGEDGVLTLLKITPRKGEEGEEWPGFEDGEQFVSLAFSPDGGKVVGGGSKGTVMWWDLAADTWRKWTNDAARDDDRVTAIAFSPNGKAILTGDDEGTIRLYDLEAGTLVSWKAHPDWVNSVAFSADGKKLLSAGSSGIREGEGEIKEKKARLWDLSPWWKP